MSGAGFFLGTMSPAPIASNQLAASGARLALSSVVTFSGVVVVAIATVCQRTAVKRLGYRSEEALYGLRVRLFEHIHRLSIADHNEERKGSLVARVTSDVETLAQFFSWGCSWPA